MLNSILPIFLIIPFLGFLLSVVVHKKNEVLHSRVAFGTAGIQNILALAFTFYWALSGGKALNIKEFMIYSMPGYEYFVDFYFDRVTAVFLVVGSILTFLITLYSRYYLHREEGYKRFFNTILFFYLGYNIIILSGNFETLFIGWEVMGLSSFLLIAFYRDRYLPVRNAFKVFSVYRVSDIAMILAMWMSHHLWHHNVTFLELNNYELVDAEVQSHYGMCLFISSMILLSANVKSAQFPFSSWLPRAMEGPTPSSAIFYSSLSVHIGVFFLLRTFPLWEHQEVFRWIVGIAGLLSSIIATFIGNAQSTVKSQIAYSSIAQIGLIFIEIALGLELVALIHFTGNAFLRTYQLLVSPSTVTYLIREQFYTELPKETKRSGFLRKLFNSIYVFSVKEWNLDTYQFRFLWNPFKKLGNVFYFLNSKTTSFILVPAYLLASYVLINGGLSEISLQLFPNVLALIALVLSLRSFVERKSPEYSFSLVAFSHFWIALAISFNEHFNLSHTLIYLSGVVLSLLIGLAALKRLRKSEINIDLNGYYGHIYEYKWLAFIFLLAALGLAGFPITPTFLGEDLIFSHIHENQIFLTLLVALSAIFIGLSTVRIYIRLFLGPHIKSYHPVAHRSS
ncbi:MAG: proton-conducting transporter membrane subunit [Cytophagales bacterium]